MAQINITEQMCDNFSCPYPAEVVLENGTHFFCIHHYMRFIETNRRKQNTRTKLLTKPYYPSDLHRRNAQYRQQWHLNRFIEEEVSWQHLKFQEKVIRIVCCILLGLIIGEYLI